MKTFRLLFLLLFVPAAAFAQEPATDPAAADVLEKYIAAIGGRQAWSAIHTLRVTSDMSAMGTHRTSERIEDRDTGRFHQTTHGAEGTTEMGFDGSRVWQRTPFFRGYLGDNEPQSRALRAGQRDALVRYRETGAQFHRLPDETVGGKPSIVLAGGEKDALGRESQVKYYFDPSTYLLRRIVRGSAITATTELDDYRDVAGVKVPFTTRNIQPRITAEVHVREWKPNVPLPKGVFTFDGKESAGTNAPAADAPSPKAIARFGPDDEIPEALRVETFEQVWKKISDTYPDPKFGGVDWGKVHDEFLPRAKATAKSRPFHALLSEMLGRLGQSHFRVIPPDRVVGTSTSDLASLKRGSAGLHLRLVGSQIVVSELEPDYPAAKAGVKKGWIVTKLNGKTPNELYAAYRAENQGFELRPEISRVRALAETTGGKPGETLEAEFLDEHDEPRHLTLTRQEVPLAKTSETTFESKRLPGNVGYVKFDLFMGDVLSKFEEAVKTFADTPALIVDLRGNPGGVGDLAPSIASLVATKAGSLGRSQFRYSTRDFAYKPAANAYRGKLFILVDELTGSTSEVFAAGLQEQKRATIVGSSSAGAVLPSVMQPLATGGAMQSVVSDFRTPAGRILEGSGVKPDVEAHITRESLIDGTDPVLEKALALARQ